MSIATDPKTAATTHPLSRLTADELTANREVVEQAGLLNAGTRFMLVSLAEPAKPAVLGFDNSDDKPLIDRRVGTVLMDRGTGEVTEVIVSLTERRLVSTRTVDVTAEGQPPIIAEEFELVERLLRQDPGWVAAMERRGITDVSLVRISALSAGCFDIPGEEGRRITRCLSFLQLDDDDNAWAHPIDGVVAYLDLITGEVIDLIDDGVFDLPQRSYNFHKDAGLPEPRTTQKPIEITQPEGPSFTVDDDVVSWENWRFRIGFDPVEGLVLHQIGFSDGDRVRPIIYRASIAEMVVPYGDPSPVRFWQNYFDAGEYSLGKEANSLELGCDCLGEIRYFDAVLADDDGKPRTIKNAICMHEEDDGVLWKHSDEYTGSVDVRRSRRLVVSFFITVGNYDYGFYWYLYLDGAIELECKATGVVFASSYPRTADGSEYPWASEIAPGVGAPYHQHLFSARLDMTVDGEHNAVDEVEAKRVPIGPGNRYGNAFTRQQTRLTTESQAARLADNSRARVWQIVNPSVTNAVGKPVAYTLYPEGQPTLLADDDSSIARRAGFTTRHLWVTQYAEHERFPSGTYVNQNPGNDTLTSWVQRDRNVDNADIVLWHTFGLTHFPRPEDWPVMPVDKCGFKLKPHGFFDENPTLDTPRPKKHCADEGRADEGGCCGE
ncbi:primary-amine oxidase [Saxibacter everestensis]|uniref:Amine oxidase n=1 Tax=Saxibacter everestensis TaxID=2909229 RepID=A0ABY8QRT7_9MICO|nr:primary-amine oxidase [Brevibacteriaceae bacterium ZFBP1038]